MKIHPRVPGLTTLTAVAILCLTGCGSDAASPVGADATPTAGSDVPPAADATDDSGTEVVDPCQWYTAAEMSTLVGFEVTMAAEDTPMAYGKECAYNSDAEFTNVTVLPMSAADYDRLKSGTASMTGKTPTPVSGVGDEAYDNSKPGQTNGSVSLSAKKGSDAVQVSLATSNDKLDTLAAGRKIVMPVAIKVLDG